MGAPDAPYQSSRATDSQQRLSHFRHDRTQAVLDDGSCDGVGRMGHALADIASFLRRALRWPHAAIRPAASREVWSAWSAIANRPDLMTIEGSSDAWSPKHDRANRLFATQGLDLEQGVGRQVRRDQPSGRRAHA